MTTKIIYKKDKGEPRVNNQGLTKVYVQYQHNSKTVLFAILAIDPKFLRISEINGKNELADPYLKQHKGSNIRIKQIQEMRSLVEEIAINLNKENIDPSVDIVRSKFQNNRNSNTTKHSSSNEFRSLHKQFEEYHLRKLKYATHKSHLNSRDTVLRFIEKTSASSKVSEIDLEFYDSLIRYLFDEEDKMENTVGKIIKDLKVFLRWAKDRSFPIHPDVNKKSFRTFKKNPEIIFLTQTEFENLRNHDFKKGYLQRTRDLFIFNCRAGLRYGDLKRLNKNHIDDGIISIKQQKTDKLNTIPLTPVSSEILKKYNYQLPVISEQKMNKYLKEVCREVGIDSPVNFKGKSIPKYKAITTHTAIKTYITHCAEKGIPPKYVSEITGKSLEVIIKHYYGIDKKAMVSEIKRAFG